MNYFEHCKTLEEAKATYKKLAKQFHPDMPDGDKVLFQKLDNQYREFITHALKEKQKEYSSSSQFFDYVKEFFNDNPELLQVTLKIFFKSNQIRGFIQKNSSIIDAGIGIYNILKQ